MTEEQKGLTTQSRRLVLKSLDAGANPAVDDNEYAANLGQAFGLTAVIVIYVDGEPVGEETPVSVQWEFDGIGSYVNAYQPTVQAAAPDLNVNLQANPVGLYYWTNVAGGIVDIGCEAIAPDGTPCQENGVLTLQANTYQGVATQQGEIQLQQLDGDTFLSFGDSLGSGTGVPGLAVAFPVDGAAYPGWLGAIQLVNSVRQFTGQSGRIYSVSNTGGNFVLDAAPPADDYIYGKVEVEEGEIADYNFDDTPNLRLLSNIEGDPITQFTVNETFQLYFVFNGSTTQTPNADPTQIWHPATASIVWGWQATVTQISQNGWEITNGQVFGLGPGAYQLPTWQGRIGNVALRTRPKRLTKTVV
jgi:hypothetical protein